ncbi:M15 family metallopeptidase [Cytobacillus suaedae]|nr:M15 family metallopeptidase [Cytobacillus suaedae]
MVLFVLLVGCKNTNNNLPPENASETETNSNEQTEEKKNTETQSDNTEPKVEDKDSTSLEDKEESPDTQEDSEWVLEDVYFNKVEEQDGLLVILNPENILALVNKEHSLPPSYIPEGMVAPDVRFSFGDEDVPKRYIRKEAAIALEEMFVQAEKEGIYLFAVSGYRAYETQAYIFDSQVRKVGEEMAMHAVALPGQSEHQTGLAIDVTSRSAGFLLEEQFGETPEGKWVQENAHLFGYIVRYQKGKEEITGYQYEPWHLRYVGKEIAKVIYENDITLEEYFDKVKGI